MPTVSALQAHIESKVGGRFYVQITSVNVGASATKLVDHNFERMGLVLINTGSNDASVAPQSSVTTSTGILLGKNGGNASLDADEDLALVGWEWWAIPQASTTTFLCIEVIRYQETSP